MNHHSKCRIAKTTTNSKHGDRRTGGTEEATQRDQGLRFVVNEQTRRQLAIPTPGAQEIVPGSARTASFFESRSGTLFVSVFVPILGVISVAFSGFFGSRA